MLNMNAEILKLRMRSSSSMIIDDLNKKQKEWEESSEFLEK